VNVGWYDPETPLESRVAQRCPICLREALENRRLGGLPWAIGPFYRGLVPITIRLGAHVIRHAWLAPGQAEGVNALIVNFREWVR
jgi:hypothetical protein